MGTSGMQASSSLLFQCLGYSAHVIPEGGLPLPHLCQSMGRRKWRPCSSFYGHDLEIAHIISSHLPSARNLNHVTLSLQRSLGNGDSSKELRRGVVFLKGRREWTMGDNLLSLHKKMSKGRLLCASAIRLQYTLRKVCKNSQCCVCLQPCQCTH